ncbi:MAG TPA: S-layer homology domain-containing protein [Chloroflexia bacterium]|nr:S-layer homology domain-containing protein [Chloroflexia bacterium]
MLAVARRLKSYALALAWLAASLAASLALMVRPAGAEAVGRSYPITETADVATATPTPACGMAWRQVPSPMIRWSYLAGVSALAWDDAWAVGVTRSPTGTLTMHWDGTQWSVMSSPAVSQDVSIGGVTAISHNDVWAVGYYDNDNQLLTMHWDGTQWSVVPNPSPDGALYDVDASASNNVWAAGYARGNPNQSLVMRWEGSQWAVVPVPFEAERTTLVGVDVVAPDDVWAVGYTMETNSYRAFAMHWGGSGWTVLPPPSPGQYSVLDAVVALAPDDVWAGGYAMDSGAPWTLFEHWDGSAWSVVPAPANTFGVSAMDAATPDDIWAVGGTELLHWDGTSWSLVSTPSISPVLNDIDVRAGDDVWSVGEYGPSYGPKYNQTWRYNDPCAPIPTSTPTYTPAPSTVTATPTSTACVTLQGSITSNDPVQIGMVARSGTPSSCPGRGCSSVGDSLPRHYKIYEFYFPYGSFSTGCFTVTLEATGCPGNLYSAAYTTFDPNNVCQNVEGDTGDFVSGSVSYSFELYRGTTYRVVVHEAVPDSGCSSYTLKVSTPLGCYYIVTATPTPGPTFTPTRTPTPTRTAISPSATRTQTATATLSAGVICTPTYAATSTSTPFPTSTPCVIAFSDVPADSAFYSFVRCLACREIISGYSDGTFRPGNDITRGQIAKMVSNAAGFSEDPGPQIYEDVPPASPFYAWINRLSMRGHMTGYLCGLVPEEPCEPPANRPYFRPNASATRGQLAKIVSNAAGFGSDPIGLFYTDVPQGHIFYLWIMRLTQFGVMRGYPCGGEGEPCDDANRPYFRPFANVTRGQASKIVANTFSPGCLTPTRR